MNQVLLLLTIMAMPLTSLAATETVVLIDRAHGEGPSRPNFTQIATKLGATVVESKEPLSTASLKGVLLLYLRAPSTAFLASEKEAIIHYVKQGGSLFLVIDEESRQSLDKNQVNDLITPFSMMLTGDTPYLHNSGGVGVAGDIHAKPRNVPYSGGRAVVGGTPFAFQIDAEGNPGFPFAAYKKIGDKGRIVVMGEGMATLFMGNKDAVRLSGEDRKPGTTRYWGGDSYLFMQEITMWLVSK